MPRRRSSAHRSGSMPVSARTSVDLPWSTCPAVARTCISPAARRARPCAAASSSLVGDAPQVEQAPAALDARDHRRRAAPQWRRPARRAAATAQPGSSRPGAPPPPTAPALGDHLAAHRIGQRRRTARAAGPDRPASACHVGVIGPSSVASSAASVSLSTRSARASGWRRMRSTAVGRAEHEAGLRAAEQLVAAAGHDRRAARRSAVATSGSSGSSGCGASSPLPTSTSTGTRQPGQLARRRPRG